MSDTVEKVLSRDDNRIHVQGLDVDKWFVPRGRPPTRGNGVRPLIDGKKAMAEMVRAFRQSMEFVYVAGWQMDEDVQMLRDTGVDQSLLAILGQAVSRGADVRALIWEASRFLGDVRPDPDNADDMMHLAESNARTARQFRNRGVQVILDNHNQTLFFANLGSIHQKTAVAHGGDDGAVAFCGGIDLAYKRWDFPEHPAFDSRRDPGVTGEDHIPPFHNPDPWHDVHALVRGPAVVDLECNFIERWNDHDRDPDLEPRAEVPDPGPGGTNIVQVQRTLPGGNIHGFAPRGEFGIRTGYLRAIRRARDYIYIENQYLVSETITNELVAAMNRANAGGRTFRLIILLPHLPEEAHGSGGSAGSGGGGAATIFHQRQMILRLRAAAPDRATFQVYYLRQPAGQRDIYVHSKIMIVDDIWATIGSANLNRRSLCFDAEINVAVVDTEVSSGRRRFARDFRLALWQEHLGLHDPADLLQIEDPIAGTALWTDRAGSNQAHIVCFDENENPGDDGFLWGSVIDPECEDDDEVRAWEESINT